MQLVATFVLTEEIEDVPSKMAMQWDMRPCGDQRSVVSGLPPEALLNLPPPLQLSPRPALVST